MHRLVVLAVAAFALVLGGFVVVAQDNPNREGAGECASPVASPGATPEVASLASPEALVVASPVGSPVASPFASPVASPTVCVDLGSPIPAEGVPEQ